MTKLNPLPIVQDIPLDQLTPAPWNPRLIKEKRFKELCESMKRDPEFVRLRPALCNTAGIIYAGNQRYRAAAFMKMPTLPTIVTKVSDQLAKERAIKDNNQFGEWDDSIGTLLDELQQQGVPLDQLGFTEGELEGLLGAEDKKLPEDVPPPLPTKAQSKLGDMWKLGEHILLCGDATNEEDIKLVTYAKPVDMIWVDPPYNVDYEGKTGDALKIENDKMNADQFDKFLVGSFRAMYAFAKAGAPIYVACPSWYYHDFVRALQQSGFLYKQQLIWIKSHFVLGRQDYNWQQEPIIYGWKPGEAHAWYGAFDKSTVMDEEIDLRGLDKTQLVNIIRELRNARSTDVLRHDRPSSSEEHPTMKPVSLVAQMIRNSSMPEDTVLDTFGGSGSTLIACEHLRRRCRMIELDPRYCDVIIKRWENLTEGKAKLL